MILGAVLSFCLTSLLPPADPDSFRVMSWNILHGGRDDGEDIGPQRVIEIIQSSGADIVAMQETYGSGERISQSLEFQFHPRGTNVSILSRFPILEDLSVFEEFKCVGALIELPQKRRIAFYSIWLPYAAEIWEEGTRNAEDPQSMVAACAASHQDLKKIWAAIQTRLDDPSYEDVPIVIAGDFNSMSHFDYIPAAQDQFDGVVLPWPTSQVLSEAGFIDAWRRWYPEVDRMEDRTWSPRFPKQQADRIDFVYYRGDLELTGANRIDTHVDKFPSDHAAVIVDLQAPISPGLRVVSYNIRHGAGTDNRLDLDRTAGLLRHLQPDIVGLQEVDNRAQRSGGVDQVQYLGQQLGMESAFGAFMDYDGGEYGLGILSRYPVKDSKVIRLPEGNEPRVALACTLELPGGKRIVAVNIHLDWVRDDRFRFKQAEKLAEFLKTLELPYIVLGDFNDVLGSRTLNLLCESGLEADKPEEDSMTIPSTDPRKEIDFIVAHPASSWRSHRCRVVDAKRTSDHRPVLAILELIDQ